MTTWFSCFLTKCPVFDIVCNEQFSLTFDLNKKNKIRSSELKGESSHCLLKYSFFRELIPVIATLEYNVWFTKIVCDSYKLVGLRC